MHSVESLSNLCTVEIVVGRLESGLLKGEVDLERQNFLVHSKEEGHGLSPTEETCGERQSNVMKMKRNKKRFSVNWETFLNEESYNTIIRDYNLMLSNYN